MADRYDVALVHETGIRCRVRVKIRGRALRVAFSLVGQSPVGDALHLQTQLRYWAAALASGEAPPVLPRGWRKAQ